MPIRRGRTKTAATPVGAALDSSMTGNWTRANSESCFLGVRGNPKRISKSVHQLIQSPIREHSRKPDEVRERIIELMGDLPRVELFARQATPGWDVWGNQIGNSILLPNAPP